MFNAIFNNISVTSISWWSILLVEETGVPGENTVLPQITDKVYHIFLYRVHLVWSGFELTTLVVIYTDCIGSCKPIYHTAKLCTKDYWIAPYIRMWLSWAWGKKWHFCCGNIHWIYVYNVFFLLNRNKILPSREMFSRTWYENVEISYYQKQEIWLNQKYTLYNK